MQTLENSRLLSGFDVWAQYNYQMKLLKQEQNDNFILVPKRKKAAQDKQLRLL